MKKNIIIKLFLIVFALTLFTGCNKTDEINTSSDPTPRVEDTVDKDDANGEVIDVNNETSNEDSNQGTPIQGITVNHIDFEVTDISTLSQELQTSIETLKQQRGYEFWLQEDGSYLIMISAGEKSTAGFGIEVQSIEDNEGKTVISVKETEPEKDSMQAQVITYPVVVVKASGITDRFIIHDQNQAEYTRVAADATVLTESENGGLNDTVLRVDNSVIDYSKPIEGIYNGQIDTHSIEVSVGDTFAVFYADDIDQYLKGIEVGDKIEVTASISPSDQILLESIQKLSK